MLQLRTHLSKIAIFAGWVLFFCLTTSFAFAANSPPSVGTITPSPGTSNPNQAVILTATYTDPDGWENIQNATLLVNTSTNGANCLYAYYSQNTKKVYLRNDTNTAWLGGFNPGSSNTVQNSYVKIDCSQTTASGTANTLTVNWNVAFKSTFSGTKNIYLSVNDDVWLNSGWINQPTWKWRINQAPQVGTITPSSGSNNVNVPVTFTTTYSDPDGWQDIQNAYLLVNNLLYWTKCFLGYYDQNANKLYLRNDTNTASLDGFSPGSSNTIENSYVKLNCAATTVSGSGNNLTVNWNITFKSNFSGTKNTYLYVKDDANATNGWTQKGTWTITNILSISINPKLWSVGSTEVNTTLTMTQANKITVINDGTDSETFALSLINPEGWTASTSPGRNTYVLSGIFCNSTDIPQPGNFDQDTATSEDVILTKTKTATKTIFGYSQATASGVSVPVKGSRSLYLQFQSPNLTDKTQEQDISVVVSCQTP